MNTLITIITLTKNSDVFISKMLESVDVALSKLPDRNLIEHVFVDGYSNDKTLEIIKSKARTCRIYSRDPKGIYDALNYGVSFVTSPYLMYLHSDDEIHHDFLLCAIKELSNMKSHPTIVVGTVSFIDRLGMKLYDRFPPIIFKWIQLRKNLIFHPNAIYPTLLEKNFPYRTDLGLEADHHHITEICNIAKIVRARDLIYKFRVTEFSSTVQKINGSKKTYISLAEILCRLYLMIYETNLIARFANRILRRNSIWRIQ